MRWFEYQCMSFMEEVHIYLVVQIYSIDKLQYSPGVMANPKMIYPHISSYGVRSPITKQSKGEEDPQRRKNPFLSIQDSVRQKLPRFRMLHVISIHVQVVLSGMETRR